jgi:hypothetical protein
MVSFRLSEQEYDDLLALCSARGARSLSDLARDAMQGLLNETGVHHDNGHKKNRNHNGLEFDVEKLLNRMDEMDHELKRLAKLVVAPRLAAEKTA